MALNASLFLPFGLLVDAPNDASLCVPAVSDSSGEGLRRTSSLIRIGAATSAGVSDSSSVFAALLASASFFLSARTSSSLRFGAGSMPNSECRVEDASGLLALSLGFLLSGPLRPSSSRPGPSSLSLNVGNESTLITLRLVDVAGGGSEIPLAPGLEGLAEAEGGGSFDASADFGGGKTGPGPEEDGSGFFPVPLPLGATAGDADCTSSSSESLPYPASDVKPVDMLRDSMQLLCCFDGWWFKKRG